MKKSSTKSIQIRFPVATRDRLRAWSYRTGVSINSLVVGLVERALERKNVKDLIGDD